MEDYTRNFAKLVEVKVVKGPVQTIIINNEEQQIEQTITQIVCPSCGHVLMQQDGPGNLILIKKELTDHAEEYYNMFRYCPQCAQKLMYERPIVSQQ